VKVDEMSSGFEVIDASHQAPTAIMKEKPSEVKTDYIKTTP